MYVTGFIDCPEQLLGNIPSMPPPAAHSIWHSDQDQAIQPSRDCHPQISEGAAVINGVALPLRVIQELKRLGVPLAWYTHGELAQAVDACAFDAQLIDDPDGVNFRDKMVLTDREKEEQSPFNKPHIFCEQIADEREHARHCRLNASYNHDTQ